VIHQPGLRWARELFLRSFKPSRKPRTVHRHTRALIKPFILRRPGTAGSQGTRDSRQLSCLHGRPRNGPRQSEVLPARSQPGRGGPASTSSLLQDLTRLHARLPIAAAGDALPESGKLREVLRTAQRWYLSHKVLVLVGLSNQGCPGRDGCFHLPRAETTRGPGLEVANFQETEDLKIFRRRLAQALEPHRRRLRLHPRPVVGPAVEAQAVDRATTWPAAPGVHLQVHHQGTVEGKNPGPGGAS
jgi:hypothetical protein